MWTVIQFRLIDGNSAWYLIRKLGYKNWTLFRKEHYQRESQRVGNFSSLILAKECVKKYAKNSKWEVVELLRDSKKANIMWRIAKQKTNWDVIIDNRGLQTFHDNPFSSLSVAKQFVENCEGL